MNGDKINGRTPEEIKKGLECYIVQNTGGCKDIRCRDCSRYNPNSAFTIEACKDALAFIQQLERERDAAVEQLRKGGRACSTCKFSEDIPENDKICEECRLTGTKLLHSNWEWVGPQEVE